MSELNTNGLRGIQDEITTEQLRQMLDEELQKEKSDPAAVKLILAILESRHETDPGAGSAISEEARQKYHQQMEELFPLVPRRRWMPLLRAASVVLILGLLFTVVPQKAEAETFWEMLQRLTNTVISYLDRDETLVSVDYVFETDNEGLQQVYDAVVELGVTEPMVPMWLPDGCEILSFEERISPMQKGICATFAFDGSMIVYKLDVYEGEPAHQYYRDDSFYDSFERNGVTYNITQNNDRWVAVWTKDNVEASITLNCQEETLRRILKTIYVMEE